MEPNVDKKTDIRDLPGKIISALKKISYTKVVASGYFLLVIIGTLLLMLPVASRTGDPTSFPDALTTATSASCVTGLIVFDTFTHWSLFGQIVILFLIQIGGLGYMTILALFSVIFKRKIGLRERNLLKESTNSMQLGGLVKMTKKIITGTAIFEFTGAVILTLRFLGRFGIRKAIYYGIFHSVSAFCNAGFDLMGAIEPGSSLMAFNSDPVVLITISLLIIVGGIGFLVWDNVVKFRFKFGKYNLHSKIAIVTSIVLIFGGAIITFGFEYNNTLADMNIPDKILNSFFISVSARTAGFGTVALENLSGGSVLLHILLMLIGGSPGSTAGGLKTTTFAVLLIAAKANIKGNKNINVFGRRLEDDIVRKALTVAVIYVMFAFVSVLAIGFFNPQLSLSELMFEVSSAIGTVGLTGGAMAKLNIFGQMLITLLMYCGRVGSLSFAMIFTGSKNTSAVMMPSEKIIIG